MVPPGVVMLTVTPDGHDYLIGRPDLGIFVAVPEPGAVLIRALQAGADLEQATSEASASAGEEIDGPDFLTALESAGMLADVTSPSAYAGGGRSVRWIEGVRPSVARPLFGRTAWAVYGSAAVFVVSVLWLRPNLRPTFEDAWFLPDPLLSLLAYLPIALLLAACHEGFHWLAGRALGVPAVFRVSCRGIFLVFETDLTQIVMLPRRRRYGPLMAGLAFDTLALAAALGLRLLHRSAAVVLPVAMDRLLGVVVLAQVLAISWQFLAIMLRSDIYAVLANILGCHNLYRATWLTTKDRLLGLSPTESTELGAISEHDRQVARWFGLLYLAGLAGMLWVFLALVAPFLVAMGMWLVGNLASAAFASVEFWESVAVLSLLVVQWGLPPALAVRERRLRLAGRLL